MEIQLLYNVLILARERREKFAHIEELRKIEKDWNQINIPIVHIHGAKDKMLAPSGNIKCSKTHICPKVLRLLVLPEARHLIHLPTIQWCKKNC